MVKGDCRQKWQRTLKDLFFFFHFHSMQTQEVGVGGGEVVHLQNISTDGFWAHVVSLQFLKFA